MINQILSFRKKYGLFKAIKIHFTIKYGIKGSLKLPGIKYPFFYRPNTLDSYTIREIFCKDEYDFDLQIQPRFIIDGGANIGLTSLFFANKYKDTKILAIEPEENNYKLLERNTSVYKNITILKAAIWKKTTNVKVKDRGFGIRGFVVEEVEKEIPGSFRSTSISQLLPANKKIDLLKLDVEGSEKYIFEDNYEEWLPNVKYLIIELHDRMIKGCSQSVFRAIAKYNFSVTIVGENLLFKNEDLVTKQ